MIKKEPVSKNFVFKTIPGKYEIEFVGDFEGLYLMEDDPWYQSGTDDRLKDYYAYSRKLLVNYIIDYLQPQGGDAFWKWVVVLVMCRLLYNKESLAFQ